MEDEDFRAEAAIVNFYGPGMLRENVDCSNDCLQFQYDGTVNNKILWKLVFYCGGNGNTLSFSLHLFIRT